MVNIALIFSYGVSIEAWRRNGSIHREIRPYIKLKKNNKINYTFFTFDLKREKNFVYKKKKFKLFTPYSKYRYFQNKTIRFISSFIYPFFVKKNFKDIDIIKTNQMWGSWTAIILKFILKKPLIIRCGYEIYRNEIISNQNFKKRIFLKYLSQIAYSYADRIMVTTPSIKQFIIQNFKISGKKISIQKNWVDTEKFKPRYLNNNSSIYVGRLSKEKNLINLLKIIKKTNLKLFIYGDGPQKKNLKKLITSHKKQIYFKGIVPNNKLPAIFNKSCLFFLISDYEGQPKSLLEAMSCGLIVIGKNSTGINEIIKHNQNGFLLKKDESNINDILKYISLNNKKLLTLRKRARNYVIKNHNINDFIEVEQKLYKELYDSKNT